MALLNSAASSRPRSIAETISPPGSALTAAPRPVNTSIEMPTVRNLTPLKILRLGDRLLEPAERLGRHRPVRERDHVGADRGVQLFQQLLAAAVLVPGEQHVGVHRIARARTPQRQGVLLAVVIDQHAVAAVERALRDGVEQAEGGHHGAGGKHLDLEVAAGHVVHLLGVVERVFVENILGRPGALPAHADRALRLRRLPARRRSRQLQRRQPLGSGAGWTWCPCLISSFVFSPFCDPVRDQPLFCWEKTKACAGVWQECSPSCDASTRAARRKLRTHFSVYSPPADNICTRRSVARVRRPAG